MKEKKVVRKGLRGLVSSLLLCMVVFMTGCSDQVNAPKSLVIADQFGLAYAPIEIMKAKPFLEERLKAHGLDDVTVTYQRLGNTAAIREAMLADELDIGFMAIPPFLLGIENGMDWKIISAVSESPVGLVGYDTETLEDISKDKKIILPQIGSVQHILLGMASEDQFQDWSKFNEQIVAMPHPDGMASMMSNSDLYYHFTTPPFLEMELEDENLTEIISGSDIFDDSFTFIISVCPSRVYRDEALYTAFEEALEMSIDFINQEPEEARAILYSAYDYSPELVDQILDDPEMTFTTEVKGVGKFQDYMIKMDLLESDFDIGQLFWDPN